MLIPVISILLASLCHADWSGIVTSYQYISEGQINYKEDWTVSEPGYWITGFKYAWASNDAWFTWHYGRPSDAVVTNIQSQQTSTLTITDLWNGNDYHNNDRQCPGDSAMYKVESIYHEDTSGSGNKNDDDRYFTFTCIEFPPQFTKSSDSCRWIPETEGEWLNVVYGDGKTFDFKCGDELGGNAGYLRGIESSYHADAHYRRFRFQCCDLEYTPIETINGPDDSYALSQIESSYADGIRTFAMTGFRKPKWYSDDIMSLYYSLSDSPDANNWVRVCPTNGAFRSITLNDGTFSFECAQFVDDIAMSSCAWTEFLNEFHGDFTGESGEFTVIRGIQSYYSGQSDDYRFKIYCCEFDEGPFSTNTDISITLNAHSSSGSGSQGIITFDLCWNNHLYQGIKTLNEIDQYTVDDMLEHDSCGNSRTITVSMDGTEDVTIESIGVRDNDVEYTVELFSSQTSNASLELMEYFTYSGITVIQFRDDFLTECVAVSGCTADLFNLDDFQQYLLTITPCASFPAKHWLVAGSTGVQNGDKPDECTSDSSTHGIASVDTFGNPIGVQCCWEDKYGDVKAERDDAAFPDGGCIEAVDYFSARDTCVQMGRRLCTAHELQTGGTMQFHGGGCNFNSYHLWSSTPCLETELGVVLRGLNGNLDKEILNGPPFDEVFAGKGNIGDLIHVSIEYESGTDFCIESVTVYDPYNGAQEFGKDFFGDGTILSEDCSNDGYFRLLSNIQYVPCFEQPFSITTYETSLYTSIQIHSCDGSDGGIAAAKSSKLSLTITGMSKDDTFVSSSDLLLKSSTEWGPGESRDYTLQLSGDFEKISLISITNNDGNDALCVDSVLINGKDAFLTHYWVGPSDVHDSLPTIPAILEWPICDIELTTTISAKSEDVTDPDAVLTASCVNRNRLISTDCEISQTFETYEEVSWQQEIGTEVTKDITMESGTSTELSASMTLGISSESTAGITNGVVSAEKTMGFSFEASLGSSREWSSSVSSSKGISKVDVTTDGTVNGETIAIECSGGVSVPPSQQVQYSLMVQRTEATLTTLTDIKMTKCSKYLYDKDENDPNDYIYIYGIKGVLSAKDATNCYVEFSQSERVSPADIKCGQERALAAREWGTFVPQCDPDNPEIYMPCQCAYGDSKTLPTCGCVDRGTGNLNDITEAAVVAETETYKWTDWCIDHCGVDSVYPVNDTVYPVNDTVYPNEAAAKAPPILEHDVGNEDVLIHLINEISNKKEKFPEYNFNNLGAIGFLMIGLFIVITLIYGINSCISWYNQYPLNKHKYHYHETEVENV